jgi:guanylate kinase
MIQTKRCIVMCGPSGVGKSSVKDMLMKEFPGMFGFSVSHTTRKPRPGEKDGVDYHYVEKEDMEEKISRHEMLEYAHVHSNIYGTSIAAVEDVINAGQKCILDIDVQGVENVKRSRIDGDCAYIFVAPPDYETLEKRLRGRGTETEEKVQTRLNNAKKELAYQTRKDFWSHVLVNDDLEKAYGEFKTLIVPDGDLAKSAAKDAA